MLPELEDIQDCISCDRNCAELCATFRGQGAIARSEKVSQLLLECTPRLAASLRVACDKSNVRGCSGFGCHLK